MRGDLEDRLISVLFKYRITPHTTTGGTPTLLQIGIIPRSRLSAIMPHVQLKDISWRSGKRPRLRARRVKVRLSLRAIILSLENLNVIIRAIN